MLNTTNEPKTRRVVWRTKRRAAALLFLAAVAVSCGGSSDAEIAEPQAPVTQDSTPSDETESLDPTAPPSTEPTSTESLSTEPPPTEQVPTETVVAESNGSLTGPINSDVDFGASAAEGFEDPPLLDVWATDELENAPVLVVLHGIPIGRRFTSELAAEFARRGYVVFNVEWQFNPRAPSFASGGNLHGACAVRFARENASQYGGNPNDVAVVGHSAGGAIGAVLGLNGDAISGQCMTEEASAVPDRVIALAGMFEYQLLESSGVTFGPLLNQQDPELWATINPYEQLDQAARLTALLIHGSNDDVIPLASTERFSEELASNGADVTTYVLDGVDHRLVFGIPLKSVADLVDAWYGQ